MTVETLAYGLLASIILAVVYGLYYERTRYFTPQKEGMYPANRAKSVLVPGYIGKDASLAQRWFGEEVKVVRGIRNLVLAITATSTVVAVVYGIGWIIQEIAL